MTKILQVKREEKQRRAGRPASTGGEKGSPLCSILPVSGEVALKERKKQTTGIRSQKLFEAKKEEKDPGPRWPAGVDRQREGGSGRGSHWELGARIVARSTPQSETGARTIEST